MAQVTKSADRIGHFTRAANSAPPPVRVDIRKAGDFADGVEKAVAQGRDTRTDLHRLSDATQRHPTKRYVHENGHPKAVTDRDEGGAYTVRPAKTVDELQGQIQLLIRAFRDAEGREPTATDSGFWTAYAELIHAHEEQVNLGSAERMTEPLATGAKPDRGNPPPHAPPASGETVVRKQRSEALYAIIEAGR